MRFEVYQESNGEWRWRLRSSNSKIIADSAESYKRKYYVLRAIDSIKSGVETADIRELSSDE